MKRKCIRNSKTVLARISAGILTAAMILTSVPQTWVVSAAAKDGFARSEAKSAAVLDGEEGERTRLFNDSWLFQLEPEGDPQESDYDDSQWRSLTLPHDWSIEQDFDLGSGDDHTGGGQGRLPGGKGWYRKYFTLPRSYDGKRVNIDFDGVYLDSYIYVNGKLVGNYPEGYVPFSFDITDYVVCDGVTENVIAVSVNNPTTKADGGPTSRWYSGSGIYRDVHLTVTEPVHVKQYGTVIRMPDIKTEYDTETKKGKVSLEVNTTVENEGSKKEEVSVRSTILNYEDDTVFEGAEAAVTAPKTAEAGEKVKFQQEMVSVDPKLWSVEEPNLYKLRTEILVGDQVVDTYEERFGFSWSEFDADEGFLLNGEWMKLQGVCLHHDQGSLGSVANPTAMARQVRIMKEMGVNAIRTAHNAASPEFIRICDEMGMLVNEESFDGWSKDSSFAKACTHPDAENYVEEEQITWGEFDIQQIVKKDRNHPSIILWSIGNEVYDSRNQYGYTAGTKLIRAVKHVDQDHPVTTGENKYKLEWDNQTAIDWMTKVSDELDVVGLNYAEYHTPILHEMHPEWKIYGSEQSSAVKSRGYYSGPWLSGRHLIDNVDSLMPTDAQTQQLSSYDNRSVRWGRTATDAIIFDRDNKYNAVFFVWTGFDYIGEPTPFGGSSKSSYFGIVDTCGFPKDEFYLYQSQWTSVEENPMVHIMPHWNWEDDTLRKKVTYPAKSELEGIEEGYLIDYAKEDEGKIPLRIYSNAPAVELFVLGPTDSLDQLDASKSLGKKEFTQKVTSYGKPYQQQSETSDRLYLEWALSWEEYHDVGTTIVAVAYNEDGDEIARDMVVTADEASKLEVSAESQAIKADGSDLCYITVDITDENGNFAPNAMNEIFFNITGDGKIVGVDNGDAASYERYKDYNGVWKRKAFNGKALVIVQSTEEAGSFTLTATSAGLKSDSVTVYTTAGETDENAILGYETEHAVTALGEIPSSLPETVYAVKANGEKEQKSVVWNPVTQDQVAKVGEVAIKGTADGGGEVTLILTVRGPVGIRPVHVVTAVHEQPKLPETAEVIWSDGMKEKKPVTWEDVSLDQLGEPGTFDLTGTVEGYPDMAAKVTVRVANTEKVNIALASNGTKITASARSDLADLMIDGAYKDCEAWNNQLKSDGENDKNHTATLTFDRAYTISETAVSCWKSAYDVLSMDLFDIEYWDMEAGEWKFVSNLKKPERWTTWSRREFSFDPVTTNQLRYTLATEDYAEGKNAFNCTEIEVFSHVAAAKTTTELSDIQVNGKTIENFEPGTTSYTYPLAYDAAEIPVVTASGKDGSSCFVRQALSVDGSAVIEVTSEDGKHTAVYAVMFRRNLPPLSSVELENGDTVDQEAIVVLKATGILEDGTRISQKDAAVSFSVENGTGEAEISNGRLLAYEPGTVTVTATMTYQGITRQGQKTITITENIIAKNFVSFSPVSVKTVSKEAPVLPEKVTVNYDTGLPRKLAVTWDEIDPGKYASINKFEVEGTVEGISEKAKATVEVVDVIAAENVSAGVPEGYPDTLGLPAQTTVHYSDGTTGLRNVTWSEHAQIQGDYRVYEGSVDGLEWRVKATIRTVESELSDNHFSPEGGYLYPVGIASYTDDRNISDDGSRDGSYYLNDVDLSFDLDKKWSNEGRTGEWDWVAATPSFQGRIKQVIASRFEFGVFGETSEEPGIRLPEDYKIEYYTGPEYKIAGDMYGTTVPDAGHVGDSEEEEWKTSPLNDPDNWTEVNYVNGKPEIRGNEMMAVEFEPVVTYMVRLSLKSQNGAYVAVNEIRLYGETAKESDTATDIEISVDGVSYKTTDFSAADKTLMLKCEEGAFPEVKATAGSNAAVTVIPATVSNPVATIRIVPESGVESGIQEYKIEFVQFASGPKNAYEKIEAVRYDEASGSHTNMFDDTSYPEAPFVKDISNDGTYFIYNEVDFGTDLQSNQLKISYSSGRNAATQPYVIIEIRENGKNGTLLGTANLPVTGGWFTFREETVSLPGLTGVKNLCFYVKKAGVYLDYFQFTSKEGSGDSQEDTRDPYTEILATTYNDGSKEFSKNEEEGYIESISSGDYVGFTNLEFGKNGSRQLKLTAANNKSTGAATPVNVYDGKPGAEDSRLLASTEIAITGGWFAFETFTVELSEVLTGEQDLYLEFPNGACTLKAIQFVEEEAGSDLEEVKELVSRAEGLVEDAQTAAQAAAEASKNALAAKDEANSAKADAQKAETEAQTAAEQAEKAEENARKAQQAAEAASQTAQNMASDAQTSAQTAEAARKSAQIAQQASEAAKTEAENARATALEAQKAAVDAQTKAEAAESNAISAQQTAQTAAKDAEDAQTKAGDAMGKALEAQKAAEDAAADAAETKKAVDAAKASIEEAQEAVLRAEGGAKEAADQAEKAKTEAKSAQAAAEDAAEAAGQAVKTVNAALDSAKEQVRLAEAARDLAQTYAEDAKASADRAEAAQAAAQKAAEDARKEAEAVRSEFNRLMEEYRGLEKFKTTKMKLKSVKSSSKKTVKVSWKTVKGADGYEIQYARKANFAGKKKLLVKKGAASSAKLRKLAGKKTYYVRVRAYQVTNGEKEYTRFSNKKKVRVK